MNSLKNNFNLDISKLILGLSSRGKLEEYKGFNLPFKQILIADAPEVLGSEEEVIIYKAIHFGENILVEDTSLDVEGEDIGVNIKWLIKDIHSNNKFQNKKAFWSVYLGFVQGENIYISRGIIEGRIDINKKVEGAFGFDSVFVPNGSSFSLWELKKENNHL